MKTKKIVLAALAGTALLAAVGAQARDGQWDRGDHGYRGHYQNHYYYRPAPYYYAPPAPVYYAPAPVYYAPAPVYYAPQAPVYYAPRPAIYGQIPIGHHAGISFRFPL